MTTEQGLKEFTEASKGLMRMAVIGHNDFGLLLALTQGNQFAIDCALAVEETLHEMRKSRKFRPLCLCCEHRFPRTETPFAFLILLAGAFEGSSYRIASPICQTCYQRNSRAQLTAKAVAYVKEVWPSSNPIWIAPSTDRLQ